MKNTFGILLIAALASAVCVTDLNAQRRNNQERQNPGDRMAAMLKTMPIVKALDSNGDGEISAEEIENAVAALKKLDKDGDGLLKSNEIMPDMNRNRPAQRQRGRNTENDSSLKVGQAAPTFKLKSLDGDSETNLAEFKGKKPVVLFFGSYT